MEILDTCCCRGTGTWGLRIVNWYHSGLSTLPDLFPNIVVKRATWLLQPFKDHCNMVLGNVGFYICVYIYIQYMFISTHDCGRLLIGLSIPDRLFTDRHMANPRPIFLPFDGLFISTYGDDLGIVRGIGFTIFFCNELCDLLGRISDTYNDNHIYI